MAVISFIFGSVIAFVAAVLCYSFSGMGFAGALVVYAGGGLFFGSLLTVVGSMVLGNTDQSPEDQDGSGETLHPAAPAAFYVPRKPAGA